VPKLTAGDTGRNPTMSKKTRIPSAPLLADTNV
jgi:hypothetical protein